MKNCGNMETIVFDRDKLMKDYSEAAKEVVILPSVMGGQYYPGNDKYYEKLNMGEDKLKELRKKYIGQRVYAGGELKGYYGIITDIVPDEDAFFEEYFGEPDYWFIVQEDNNPSHFERWDKDELQKVIITTALVPLD